jgi:hypothetical protein
MNNQSSSYGGHYPTLNERENIEVKSLANRLEAESFKETLTNILEWQQRNISFWTERYYIPLFLNYVRLIYGIALVIESLSAVFLIIHIQPLLFLLLVVISSLILVIIVALTLTITIWLIHSIRKIPLWQSLKNIFVESLPMDALLKNKLCVCRDYAKLTACLLINIYPDKKIYFFHTKTHTATGIMIQNRLYMLDEHLPVLTIDKWKNVRHLKKIEQFTANGPKKVCVNSVLPTTKPMPLDISLDAFKRIEFKMRQLLDIKEQTGDKATSLKIPPILWKNGAKLYEENEMVDYSLARWLKIKISSELIELNQVTEIEIGHQEYDLSFIIHFSQNK